MSTDPRKMPSRYLDYTRDKSSVPGIILVDGLWGCGKSLTAPIVSSLSTVGPFRIDQTIEILSAFQMAERISLDAFVFGVQNKIVENHYNNSIGREINLRPNDDSAVQKTVGWASLSKRILSPNPETLWALQQKAGLNYAQVTHLLGLNYRTIIGGLGENVRILNIQRNPAYLVDHWYRYLQDFDRDRELTPSSRVEGTKIPFFAFSWVEEWLRASALERALLSIARCSKAEWNEIDYISQSKMAAQVKVLYFSSLISNLRESTLEITRFLEATPTMRTHKIVQKANKSSGNGLRRPETEDATGERVITSLFGRVSSGVLEEFIESVKAFLAREESSAIQFL